VAVVSAETPLARRLRALIRATSIRESAPAGSTSFKVPGAGRYWVDVDLVDEGICWFGDAARRRRGSRSRCEQYVRGTSEHRSVVCEAL